jgi:hypothetical protein
MNRKIWSNAKQATIILETPKGHDSITAICARQVMSATQGYPGQEQFMEGSGPPMPINKSKAGVSR